MIQQRPSMLRRSMEQFLQDTLRYPALPAPRLTADVYETVDGDAYMVEIPVPGLQSSEMTIEATPDTLTVGTRPAADDSESSRKYLQREQEQGPVTRVFDFPGEIDPDTIAARLEAGMLKIRVPRAVAVRRKVIKLQSQT